MPIPHTVPSAIGRIARRGAAIGLRRITVSERTATATRTHLQRPFQTSASTKALGGGGTGKEESRKQNFQGQLYQATAERVKAQRAEEMRTIRAQQAKSAASSRTLGGLLAGLLIAGVFYYLGSQSVTPPDTTSSTSPLHLTQPPQHNLSKSNLEASWADFVNLLGEENVKTSPEELARHASSDWSSHPRKPDDPLPFLVVYPSTTEEVSKVAKICHARRLPITAFSGGTSLEGHFAPTRGGVVIDFGRMDKILTVHQADLDVVVQPAVGWEHLNEVLAKSNLFFPPDPGPGAMIGGMVGTGCSGTNAARYGTMKEWVLSLTVVLADGAIIKTRQRPRKSSAGYDLTRMFVGSEGTLGLVTEITLKLAVKPPHETVAVANFTSVREATDVVEKIVAQGIQVAAVELLDDVQMKCINEAGMTTRQWRETPTLFFKFSGTQNAVKEQVALVKDIIKKSPNKTSFEFARNAEEGKELWEARKEALWSVIALKGSQTSPPKTTEEKKAADVGGSAGHNEGGDSQKVWTTDVAVPVSRLSDIVELTKKDIAEWSASSPGGGVGAIVGHVGDGNFHCILLFDETERKVVEKIVHRMVKRAVEMEGTVTGEHGVGLVKRDYLEQELGESTVDAMRRLKLAFDPLCLLNCDKVVRMEKNASQPKPSDRLTH
ncbi:hypothetical protein BDZ91DRAFT_712619 [Kalaharituber pfeilii]|nr:hypothetical protein BDZ91DRAFT_712619 [Kalaharituber pfeilii]